MRAIEIMLSNYNRRTRPTLKVD